uniref:ABC transporter permease n=1 Tax=Dicranema revolutum TaxID=239144 RepID=A0A4D6WQW6_9FLOR|nr:hypothetical protein [Dicranema revolutum]
MNFKQLHKYFFSAYKLSINKLINFKTLSIDYSVIIENMLIVGSGSLTVSLITAFFVSIVFTLQVAKEFIYFNTLSLIGKVLTIAFVRELSPVLTSVIVIGRVGSSFTAELATMKVTDQIDALYLLKADPFTYLITPRIIACILMLPILNFLSFATSVVSSAFICFTIYAIDPLFFLYSSFSSLSCMDIVKSLVKAILFGFVISVVSCYWGLAAKGGAKGVGEFTTKSVVSCLLAIFVFDFILSYFMFDKLDSLLKV